MTVDVEDTPPARRRIPWPTVGAFILVVLVGCWTYVALRHQPLQFDAAAYVEASEGLRDVGVLGNWPRSSLRTYGYPLFLGIVVPLGEAVSLSAVTSIFLVQWSSFVAATGWFAWSTSQLRSRRLLILVLVAANPLLVVYAPQALTESTSLTLVLVAGACLAIARRQPRWDRARWSALAGGAVASGAAMMIRPSNSVFVIAYVLAVTAWMVAGPRPQLGRRLLVAGAVIGGSLLITFAPQMVINARHHDTLSPLPAYPLADLQSKAGMKMLRYATNSTESSCGGPKIVFLNPSRPEADGTPPTKLEYYAFTWPGGPRAAFVHVFSGLDPRPFMVYQTEFGAPYERLLQVFTVGLLVVGGLGVRSLEPVRRRRELLRSPDGVFLALVAAGTTALLAVSAVELRFGTPLVLTVCVAAAVAGTSASWTRRTIGICSVVTVIVLVPWIALSEWVLSTSPVWTACS